jgi:hypothetical protein
VFFVPFILFKRGAVKASRSPLGFGGFVAIKILPGHGEIKEGAVDNLTLCTVMLSVEEEVLHSVHFAPAKLGTKGVKWPKPVTYFQLAIP